MSVVDSTAQQAAPSRGSTPDPLLTVREVAALFKVAERTVWRWAELGLVDRVRVGCGVSRFTPASVAALMDPSNDAQTPSA